MGLTGSLRRGLRGLVVVLGVGGAGCGGTSTGPGSATVEARGQARKIDHYLVNYGPWSDDSVATARHYQLVIVHPALSNNVTRDLVARIQAGVDPNDHGDDVKVLCYVSIGEDLRTVNLDTDQLRADPRFRGDGSGPRIDPRGGPDADGKSLDGIDPHGVPSTGGTGFASFYLDDNDVHNSAAHRGDGIPDRNGYFGALFVNAGDPAWFSVVDGMKVDGPDGQAGLRELLTAKYGRGLDCDGVFLDTIDTAAPNSFTDASSPNQSEFEWTAPGFAGFIRKVHETYPDKLILQNRGLFFFDPRKPQFAVNAGDAIDFVLFESYRLDSRDDQQWDPLHYPDNRYNIAPKLMAEANRPGGFTVLSLGYAEGPTAEISTDTLIGRSTLGMDSLLEDIRVTQALAGFRHYLSDKKVRLVNDFVNGHEDLEDSTPPIWSSTFNDHEAIPVGEPTPRVGIQQAEGGGGHITVRWDVALDQHRVDYVLYAQPQPFDFAGDPKLTKARRIPLEAKRPDAYRQGPGPDRYPYEATVSDLPKGETVNLVIRAVDESPASNEDTNTTVLTATP
jgi:hypothetical protein